MCLSTNEFNSIHHDNSHFVRIYPYRDSRVTDILTRCNTYFLLCDNIWIEKVR